MSRGLDSLNEAAIEQPVVAPVLFAELDFPSGFVRVSSGVGTIAWGGYDWLGIGTFGDVSGLTESAELERKTVTYTLRGVPSDLIAVVLGEQYQGRPDKVYLGFFHTATRQLIADPELLHAGRMDVSTIREGNSCTITVSSESRIAAWSRPIVRRYTDTEQQRKYPGDKGLEFISQAAQKEIVWGRKA
jgi:hypothetical protein